MLSRHHSAANHKQIYACINHGGVELLGALRRKRAGNGNASVTNLVQTLGDEFRLNRLGVNLLNASGGFFGRQTGDFIQQRGRVLVTGP